MDTMISSHSPSVPCTPRGPETRRPHSAPRPGHPADCTETPPCPTPGPAPCGVALVLSGAVAKGAYEAGVIDALATRGVPIARIVGTSAGALNGTLLAAGIRAGRVRDAADRLVQLWRERGTWGQAVQLSPLDLLHGRGASTMDRLRGLLRDQVEALLPGSGAPVDLTLVTAAADGDPTVRRDERVTSYETPIHFHGADFDHSDNRERLYTAATASAALPGLFAPVNLPDVGPCLDGAAVNDTPIAHAIHGRPDIGRVVVVTHVPALVEAPPMRGADLAGHVLDMVITERLYRDLREARAVNERLAALDQLVAQGALNHHGAQAAKHALGFCDKRPIEVTEIRPSAPLEGGAFSGLSSRALREQYIEAGRRAAMDALSCW